MKRRIAAGLTALAMLGTALPVMGTDEVSMMAYAAETSGTCGENLTWKLDGNGTLTISGTGEMYDYEQLTSYPMYTTPWTEAAFWEEIDAIKIEPGITSIGDYAFAPCSASSVTIPDGVTRLGSHSFFGLKITSVEIPDSVTQIEDGAFSMCGNLTSVEIPDNVTTLEANTFFCCDSLETITILNPKCEIYRSGKTICNSLDENDDAPVFIGTIRGYDGSTAESYANAYGYKFESLGAAPMNPNEQYMTIVGGYLISADGCKGDVVIPDGVKEIGSYVFSQNKDITSVTIPDSVTSIGYEAFFACSNLKEIHIPSSVNYIGARAFEQTPWLQEQEKQSKEFVIINHIAVSIVWNADTANKTTFVVPEGVEDMSPELFWAVDMVSSITLPASQKYIREKTFNMCMGLKTLTILDPDCEIFDSGETICSMDEFDPKTDDMKTTFNGTIKGYDGSTAESYAKKYGYKFVSLGAAPAPTEQPEPMLGLGDVNGDETVNASDAATVLIAAAKIGAGGDSGLTDAQKTAANVNGDEAINASDAALILVYAAKIGAGESLTIEEFLDSQETEKQMKEYAAAVVKLVNAERDKAGLDPVYMAPLLDEVAQKRAAELPLAFNAEHTRPDGRACDTILTDYKVPFISNGENTAIADTPEKVMEVWMNSDGHRSNILREKHEYLGVGVVKQDGDLYWVQIFTGGKTIDGAYLPE